jgi:hypothetical protein
VRGGGGKSKGVVGLQSILFTNKDNHTKNIISCEHDTFKVICVIYLQKETNNVKLEINTQVSDKLTPL